MEFIVFSDIHFYSSHKAFIRSDGMNSWLYEQLQVLDQIFTYARLNKVSTIVFDGDLFELRRIDFRTYGIVWDTIKKYGSEFDIIINMGNHDYLTTDRKSTSLIPFSDNVRVIFEPTDLTIDNTLLRLIPHGMVANSLALPEDNCDKHILFTHEDISGLQLGPVDYKSHSPLKKQIFGDWDTVFNGHIHKPQIMDNIVNIGSCMIQDFGEVGEEKRFIHYKNGEIKSIPIDCPQFYTFDGLSDRIKKMIEEDDRNYYRIGVESKLLSDSIFKRYNVVPNIIKSKGRKVRLKKTKSEEEELKEYISIVKPKLNRDKLLEIGMELCGDL